MHAEHIAVVLSGGTALAAVQAGAWQALAEAGVEPQLLYGTSAGAINAALIAGNRRERQVELLRTFWQRASLPLPI